MDKRGANLPLKPTTTTYSTTMPPPPPPLSELERLRLLKHHIMNNQVPFYLDPTAGFQALEAIYVPHQPRGEASLTTPPPQQQRQERHDENTLDSSGMLSEEGMNYVSTARDAQEQQQQQQQTITRVKTEPPSDSMDIDLATPGWKDSNDDHNNNNNNNNRNGSGQDVHTSNGHTLSKDTGNENGSRRETSEQQPSDGSESSQDDAENGMTQDDDPNWDSRFTRSPDIAIRTRERSRAEPRDRSDRALSRDPRPSDAQDASIKSNSRPRSPPPDRKLSNASTAHREGLDSRPKGDSYVPSDPAMSARPRGEQDYPMRRSPPIKDYPLRSAPFDTRRQGPLSPQGARRRASMSPSAHDRRSETRLPARVPPPRRSPEVDRMAVRRSRSPLKRFPHENNYRPQNSPSPPRRSPPPFHRSLRMPPEPPSAGRKYSTGQPPRSYENDLVRGRMSPPPISGRSIRPYDYPDYRIPELRDRYGPDLRRESVDVDRDMRARMRPGDPAPTFAGLPQHSSLPIRPGDGLDYTRPVSLPRSTFRRNSDLRKEPSSTSPTVAVTLAQRIGDPPPPARKDSKIDISPAYSNQSSDEVAKLLGSNSTPDLTAASHRSGSKASGVPLPPRHREDYDKTSGRYRHSPTRGDEPRSAVLPPRRASPIRQERLESRMYDDRDRRDMDEYRHRLLHYENQREADMLAYRDRRRDDVRLPSTGSISQIRKRSLSPPARPPYSPPRHTRGLDMYGGEAELLFRYGDPRSGAGGVKRPRMDSFGFREEVRRDEARDREYDRPAARPAYGYPEDVRYPSPPPRHVTERNGYASSAAEPRSRRPPSPEPRGPLWYERR